jgi:hypothetical protein
MGRYLRLLEAAAENRLRGKCAVSQNNCAVSPSDPTLVPDLPRLSRYSATALRNCTKIKKYNDIKEEEYITSNNDGKKVVQAERDPEGGAVSAISPFEPAKIPPQNAAAFRYSTNSTHNAEPDPGPPKPPDMQELVALHGGYSSITPEAWAEYDRLIAEWKKARALYYGETLKINLPAPSRK